MTRAAHNVDRERTAAANFLDRGGWRGSCRSYWTKAGHEYLFGEDVRVRRSEIYERDKGTCQIGKAECLGFVGWGGHLHHIEGGHTDARCWCPHNLQWACRNCHREVHPQVRWTAQEQAIQ